MATIRFRLKPVGPKIRARVKPAIPPLQAEIQNTGEMIQWRVGANGTWQDLIAIDDIDASVAIGTVTTLAAGSPATVENVGTEQDAVLDFGIPSGADGSDGVSFIWRGAYAGGTAYAADDVVSDQDSSWVALQATTGNAPPTLPTTSNSYWELMAAKGADGVFTAIASQAEAEAGTDNTKGMTPLRTAQAIAVLGGVVRRNRVANPCMQISTQNADTAGTTNNYWPADEWVMQFVTSAGALSVQRVQAVTMAGAVDRIRLSVTTADASLAAGEYLRLVTPFEGKKMADLEWGTANAKDLVLRFMGSMPDQVFCVTIRNAASDRSYVVEVDPAAADTDEVFEVVIPGCTTGTWPTGATHWGSLIIAFAAGSTFQTTPNAWQSGNYFGTSGMANGLAADTNVFEIGDVGVRADPYQTGAYGDFEVPDAAHVKVDCLRYYRIWGGEQAYEMIGNLGASSTTVLRGVLNWDIPMRTSPSDSKSGTFETVPPITISTITMSRVSTHSADLSMTGTGATAGDFYELRASNDLTARFKLDARMI